MQRATGEVGREAKREFRKRGSARRELDLDDLVLDLPPALLPAQETYKEDVGGVESNSEETGGEDEEEEVSEEAESAGNVGLGEEEELPELPPPRVISEAERRIVEKHREMADRRHQQKVVEQQMVRREAKNVKHIKRTAAVRSKSIKIRYRRIPSNKARLIYTDVISQVIKDYLRAPSTVERYVSDVVEELHGSAKPKRRRGPAKKNKKKKGAMEAEPESEQEIAAKAKGVLKEYYERINEYFTSLIDLQLSNSLIRSDLERINTEKNKLRMQIFELRKERSTVGLEIKAVRDEFRRLNTHFSMQDKHYKQLITLKEEGSFAKRGQPLSQDQLIDEISGKLDRYENQLNSKLSSLKTLRRINNLLEEKSTRG